MIHLLSPAKSLDFESKLSSQRHAEPSYLEDSQKLIKKLNSLSRKKVKEMMGLSDNLTDLNVERYQQWQGLRGLEPKSRQAIFAFTGDVYQGLEANTLTESDLDYAQEHLIVLSGLYGMLRPLDVIEPYRLEMGTTLKVGRRANLYEYWKDKLTKDLKKRLAESNEDIIVNLASNEYSKVLDLKKLGVEIHSPQFKDAKNGQYKMISFFAKKARGMMSRYIIQNQIEKAEDLQGFDLGGYRYNAGLSQPNQPVFTREENQS